MSAKKIGILTGGGGCPGLNAVIRAVVRRAQNRGIEILGIRNGWLGLIEGDVEPLTFSVIATAGPKAVDLEQFADAEVFFG